MSYIVYGPQGCGKTRNAALLRDYFGCINFSDSHPNPYGRLRSAPVTFKAEKVLYLTSEQPPEDVFYDRRVISFAEAMRMAKGGK
jgi:hypothetical protein